MTTLYRKIRRGEYGAVEEMLQEDSSRVDATEKTKSGNHIPLEGAVTGPNVRMVRILLNYGANPNVLTEAGDTPLLRAITTSSNNPDRKEAAIATVLLLIEYGADMEIPDTEYQETPLIASVYGDLCEVTKILLSRGVNINTRDITGRTALMWAAFAGSVREVTLLLEHGADISVEGLDGLNAEQLAFQRVDERKCFGEIWAKLHDIRDLREKFDAFEMIHREEGQQSLVHLLNTDIIEKIREYE